MNLPGSARSVVCLGLLGLLVGACPGRAADLKADAVAWYTDHNAIFEQAAKLATDGYASDGNKLLIDLADEDGGPVAAYVVGNTLFASDPAASYRLHLRAKQGFPDDPAAALEFALEQHRRGEHAAAIPNYRQVLDAGTGTPYAALLADCLIRTGQLKAAVQAWNQAAHDRNQAAIDAAIGVIYGPLAPTQRRSDLIAKIEGGDSTKLTELLLLDLHFDTSWWRVTVFEEGLDRDLKLALSQLGRKDARYLQLALYAKLARPPEKKPEEVRRELTHASLILGPGAVLPADSQLARALCELAVNNKAVTPAELWTAHSVELHARLGAQDRDALRLLCWLAAANHNPELTELDRLGWEEWNDPAFAPAFMLDLYREKKLTSPDDSQLVAAMAVAKDDAKLIQLRLALTEDKDITRELIVAAIKAEYRKLSFNPDGIRDSTTLNSLFIELGKRL